MSGTTNKMNGLLAAALLALPACGGGGDGSSSGAGSANTAPVSTSPSSGKVAILLTDAPTDAFCQIPATIESVDLLGGSGSQTNVFTGPITVDLLRLRNYTDFFTIDSEVPIGTYSKVRLTLSDLALVECDATGVPEPAASWDHPNLPGNGKLDLNPRSSFEVVGGETVMIKLDMDMAKSLFVHQTGNGRWQFRPVVFLDVIRAAQDKLVRVFGAASNINGTQFELCPLRPTATMGSSSTVPGTECLDVFTDGNTGIFDQSGRRVGLSSVANGTLLTAVGFLTLFDDADSDNRTDDLRLDAAVVELGDRGTFKRLPGPVISAPGNNDLFVFDPTPLDSASNAIDVRLQAGTRIFAFGSINELTSSALQPGTFGQVDGVFTVPATNGEPLLSSLIVVEQNTTPAATLLDAVIQNPIPADNDTVAATRRFTVINTANLGGRCIKTDAGTRYLLIRESNSASETTEINFADLAAGNTVDVFGADDPLEPACVLADVIQKYGTL